MPRYVAFLRGINLGKRRIAMSRLKSLVEELGYSKVETFIASGNVLFCAPASTPAAFESAIASHLGTGLGYEVETFVRPYEEVVHIARTKRFTQDGDVGITLHVGFLHQPLPKPIASALEAIRTGYDEFQVSGKEFHWLCHGRMSDSEVWALPEVKALRLPTCTLRNLKSLRKLVERFSASNT